MTDTSPRRLLETELEQVTAQLAASPEAVALRFRRACLLEQLGRKDEAKAAYLEVLARDTTHFGALTNLGNLLYAGGFRTAARTVYLQAVTHHPTDPKGHVNLANLLAQNGETDLALTHYEAALRLNPDHPEANRGLAYLLTEFRDEEQAALHRQKAFQDHPLLELPFYGDGDPVSVLLLVSAAGGMIPMRHHLDDQLFRVSVLFVEFYDPKTPLPPHDIVMNAIGDADLCRPALEAALTLVGKTTAPILNHPSRVLPTGRAENAERLGQIPGVVTAKMASLPKALLASADAPALLAEQGFSFPLLLRPPGFHTGHFFVRVEQPQDLAASAGQLPGQELLALQFLDARSPDGKIRKFRVMMIGGVLYPLHLAIAHDWKIHYFTAEMADHPEHRAEDAAFLENMPQVLGPEVMAALENVCATLGLDYGGIDFSLSPRGDVLLFEANATMVIYPPDPDARWDYRRPAVQRILDAIRTMLAAGKTLPPLPS